MGDAVDAVIHSGVCTRLIQLLNHSSYGVQTAALRVVGNIVSGTEAQTQTMILCGCIPALKQLLISTKKVVRKEACWTISNITAGTRDQIQEVVMYGVIPQITEMLPSADHDTKKEANWALANAASGGTSQQVRDRVCRAPVHCVVCFVLKSMLSRALNSRWFYMVCCHCRSSTW